MSDQPYEDPYAEETGFHFSEECDIALREAIGWAREGRGAELSPEYVLIALLGDRSPARVQRGLMIAGSVLASLGASPDKLTDQLIDTYIGEADASQPETDPKLGDAMAALLDDARAYAEYEVGPNAPIWTVHLLAAMLDDPTLKLPVLARLRNADITSFTVLRRWRTSREQFVGGELVVETAGDEEVATPDTSFATDLTAKARAGELDPVIGREQEIGRLITILGRRTKNNPALLGEPGTGKSAIAEGLAQRIASGDVPKRMRNARVMSLSLANLVADTKYRGQFEARVSALINELRAQPDTIVFIDELHSIVGAGSGGVNDGNDFANMLKPALARGELRCIGATTLDEYRRFIERDAALERRFQPVIVNEPDEAATRQILAGLVERYAKHHEIEYSTAALDACVRLASRHIANRRFPDKAIDLMDEVGSRVASSENKVVQASDVAALVAEMVNLPAAELDAEAGTHSDNLEQLLAERVLGQAQALELVNGTLRVRRLMRRRGSRKQRGPLASLALVGPDGVGKSTIAHALADALFGGRITEIDLSNYAEPHAISGLIGAPPGYVGYGDRARLVEPLRANPAQVVLLKHIDRAHPAVRALLVDLLRSGQLSDSGERVASYRDAVVIFTMADESKVGGGAIGFGSRGAAEALDAAERASKTLRSVVGEELVGLLDAVVPLRALGDEDMAAIRDARLGNIVSELRAERIELSFGPRLAEEVLALGRGSGARGIGRAIEHLVEQPIAAEMPDPPRRGIRRLLLEYRDGRAVLSAPPRRRRGQ